MELPAASLPRLSQRVWLQVVSAFVPGLILLLELSLALIPDVLTYLGTAEPSGLVSVLGVLLVISVSYVIGVLNRAIAFRLAPGLHRKWDRRTSDQMLQIAEEQFGSSATAAALGGTSMLYGDKHIRDGYFTYCKFWLRQYAPNMSIDSHELEINARFTLSTPVALSLPVVIVASFRDEITTPPVIKLLIVMTLVSLALAYLLMRRGIDGQRYERQDALIFYIATWLVHDNPPPNLTQSRGKLGGIAESGGADIEGRDA